MTSPDPSATLDDAGVLAAAEAIAHGQPGGTLATTHADDATPYVTYVFFHLRHDGRLLFGGTEATQHTSNIRATPEVSFLIDNRDVIANDDWAAFNRVVVEGSARIIPPGDPDYAEYLADLSHKSPFGGQFAAEGVLCCVEPHRLILMRGLEPDRYVLDFARD